MKNSSSFQNVLMSKFFYYIYLIYKLYVFLHKNELYIFFLHKNVKSQRFNNVMYNIIVIMKFIFTIYYIQFE